MRRGEILAEKRCPACGVTKPRDQYHKNGPSIAQCCKACTNTRKRERYHADARVRETVCAQVARWAAAHADERDAYKRAWGGTHDEATTKESALDAREDHRAAWRPTCLDHGPARP